MEGPSFKAHLCERKMRCVHSLLLTKSNVLQRQPRTISTLTLKHKPEGEFTPPMVKFKCVKNEFPGKNGTRDRPAFVAIVGDDGEMVPLNAHRLSIFLSALA